MPKHFTHVTVPVIVWKERIEKGSRCRKKKERIYAYFDAREEENLRIGFSLRLDKRNYDKT